MNLLLLVAVAGKLTLPPPHQQKQWNDFYACIRLHNI